MCEPPAHFDRGCERRLMVYPIQADRTDQTCLSGDLDCLLAKAVLVKVRLHPRDP
jgi:hypothetical protein